MVKVRGKNSNRNTVKNGQKISGDHAAGITLLVPGVKNSRLRNSLEIRPGVEGFPWQVAYELISADHKHFKLLT